MRRGEGSVGAGVLVIISCIEIASVATDEQSQLGEDGFLADGPHGSEPESAIEEVEQCRDGPHLIPQTEAGMVVRVDFDHFHPPGAGGHDLFEDRLEPLTGHAPRCAEGDEDRNLRTEDLRFKTALTNLADWLGFLVSIHSFDFISNPPPYMQRSCQRTPLCVTSW